MTTEEIRTDERITALERQVKAQDGDLVRLMEAVKSLLDMERQQNMIASDLGTTLEIVVRQVASLADQVEGDDH